MKKLFPKIIFDEKKFQLLTWTSFYHFFLLENISKFIKSNSMKDLFLLQS